jgi:hypothetical protein
MKMPVLLRRLGRIVWAGLLLGFFAASGFAAPTNVFFTQFEAAEGYDINQDLAGQNSWTYSGTGGNGLVTNFIAGQGQQAYVGYDAPAAGDELLSVWRPINFNPLAAGLPLVKFSVLMSIVDSSGGNTNYDWFRWSVYNSQGSRLFSIEFDNTLMEVNYQLDGNNPIVTNVASFIPNNDYELTVTMNFVSNRWSASLGDALIATNLPITTTALPLDLGDVDAVWWLQNINAPGNNYLLFDNYRITAEAPPPPPAQVRMLSAVSGGSASLRVFGQNATQWSLDASTNLVHWTALKTNTITGGSFDHVDTTAAPFSRRFYRARWVP